MLLFLIENLPWVLPKADWIRVLAEAISLITIAILDQMQAAENKRLWIEQQNKGKRSREVQRSDERAKRRKVAWSPWTVLPQSEKDQILNRKRRKLTLALLTLSVYMYIDATGASPMYQFEKLLSGLPVPGKQRKKGKSKVRR